MRLRMRRLSGKLLSQPLRTLPCRYCNSMYRQPSSTCHRRNQDDSLHVGVELMEHPSLLALVVYRKGQEPFRSQIVKCTAGVLNLGSVVSVPYYLRVATLNTVR